MKSAQRLARFLKPVVDGLVKVGNQSIKNKINQSNIPVQMYRSEGRVLNGLNTTIEDVRDNWEAITDMSKAKNYKNSAG